MVFSPQELSIFTVGQWEEFAGDSAVVGAAAGRNPDGTRTDGAMPAAMATAAVRAPALVEARSAASDAPSEPIPAPAISTARPTALPTWCPGRHEPGGDALIRAGHA